MIFFDAVQSSLEAGSWMAFNTMMSAASANSRAVEISPTVQQHQQMAALQQSNCTGMLGQMASEPMQLRELVGEK